MDAACHFAAELRYSTAQHGPLEVAALGAARVLIADISLPGGGVEPSQNRAADAFSEGDRAITPLSSARDGFSAGLLPESRLMSMNPFREWGGDQPGIGDRGMSNLCLQAKQVT